MGSWHKISGSCLVGGLGWSLVSSGVCFAVLGCSPGGLVSACAGWAAVMIGGVLARGVKIARWGGVGRLFHK